MILLILIFFGDNAFDFKMLHMALHSFYGAWNISVVKFPANLDGSITLFEFKIYVKHLITENIIFLFPLGVDMINRRIICASWKFENLTHLPDSILFDVSLNKGHVFSY